MQLTRTGLPAKFRYLNALRAALTLSSEGGPVFESRCSVDDGCRAASGKYLGTAGHYKQEAVIQVKR